MHLLWINHFAVAPRVGGGTRHYEMSRELVRRGWVVTLAASDFHLQQRTYTHRRDAQDRRVIAEDLEGVSLRYLWSAPYETNDWRRAWNWVTFARSLLAWRPDRGQPDVIIGSSPHLFAALAGYILAWRWKVPFVLEVRDLWPESIVAAGGKTGAAYLLFKWMAEYLYRRSDAMICLARGTRSYLSREKHVPQERLHFVPNGVDTAAFVPRDGSPRNTLTLLYAGAHGPANGLDIVLEAADRLKSDGSIQFKLLGDGPAKSELQQKALNMKLGNVTFVDPVPKARIPEVLSEADAGLMVLRDTPLFAYGVSPNKLFDYMAAGLPIVCNVPGEVEQMVRDAGAGEQATAGSGEDLARAIRRIADRSPEERAQMGAAARAWVTREHGREILAQRLDEILRRLLV